MKEEEEEKKKREIPGTKIADGFPPLSVETPAAWEQHIILLILPRYEIKRVRESVMSVKSSLFLAKVKFLATL